MTRILTDTELAHLTIIRLQYLLKAARARAHYARGSKTQEMNGDLISKLDYYERVKKELQRRQAT